ncbi:Cytochrome c2 [hydrothermal vent metagenome]|uniref:Cytochrome c2 n=1 Tax=hydrothermal vent metagenome TaxID=652676 RepID=A0A3B1CXN6_9ZZZZ
MKKKFILVMAVVCTLVFSVSGVAMAGDTAKGEAIFKKKKCKQCHNFTEKKKVGPGLKGVTSRHSEGWLVKWLMNPQKTWAENDAETQELRKWRADRAKAKKTRMKIKKPPLTEEETKDLIAFLKEKTS